ncbi:hypothetical protein EVAR_103998_1 [Eumeta japonica]|uniref:Uncharacterized protein n=1 Tax=Eumeta variegata TaxID=151549 RepID=A0A4C1XWR3_EUMVA|nr:hypothetical protein EVAR_103998_1 [Eumeta japonica]
MNRRDVTGGCEIQMSPTECGRSTRVRHEDRQGNSYRARTLVDEVTRRVITPKYYFSRTPRRPRSAATGPLHTRRGPARDARRSLN